MSESIKTPVSVVVIVKNGAEFIVDMLETLKEFDEVLVYDNGSTDGTQAKLSAFNNVRLIEGEFLGFGPTKHKAVTLAKNDWVLSLDVDERVSENLTTSIKEVDFSQPCAFAVLRENHFMGKKVRFSGWGNDWLIRFFHRSVANFNDSMVHENVVLTQAVRTSKLKGTIKHLAVNDLSEFLVKVNRYSSIRAEASRKSLPVPLIVLKSLFAFFRTYFLRLGFLDGWRGLVISFSNANGVFWKNMKSYVKFIK